MHKVLEEIVESNEWRYSEFARFKMNPSKVEDKLWYRMCTPMIYAHWEGFVVSSLKILIEHLNSLRLKPIDVNTNWIVIGLGNSYSFLSGKQSFEQRIEFTNRFSNLFQDCLRFEKKVETKANLKANVLREICKIFSFDFKKFDNFTRDIDQLVYIRNSIAHGENSITPTRENIESYINAITNAMDVILEEINIFLDRKLYLKDR